MFRQDIIDKIHRDFGSSDDAELVIEALSDFRARNPDIESDRIIRCIVFVASGNLDTLEQAIELARTDYRDLIMWAEYNEKDQRIRDMNKPFPLIEI
ncbi:MAG: hypothetical protein ACYTG7_06930 [Planctomycetota bacterium]|jgi:hypothetical protein